MKMVKLNSLNIKKEKPISPWKNTAYSPLSAAMHSSQPFTEQGRRSLRDWQTKQELTLTGQLPTGNIWRLLKFKKPLKLLLFAFLKKKVTKGVWKVAKNSDKGAKLATLDWCYSEYQ